MFFYSNETEALHLPSSTSALSGFSGYFVRDKAPGSVVAASREIGEGQVVLFVDNPLFRGQWHNGKLLFSNALFLVK